MDGLSKSKRRYKAYTTNKFNKTLSLDVDLKGFLCSCNNREKDCIKESYNILNKYYDKFHAVAEKPPEDDDKLDIGESLQNELSELKNTPRDRKRFQVVTSGAKNFLFIRTTVEDPVDLVKKILDDILENREQQTRFLLRLIPVETTCKAYLDDIERAFKPLAEKYFKDEPRTFSIIYNHRNNNNLSKDEVIKSVADIVSATRDDHKVDLKGANLSVIIEVIKGFAFLSVVPDFFKYKKYNLLELSKPEGEEEEMGSANDDAKAESGNDDDVETPT